MAFIADVQNKRVSAITMRMDDTWRARLKTVVVKSGKSPRSISLEAGRAHGYVFSLLNEGKDPTLGNLTTVCRVLGVSLPYILYGQDITAEAEELLVLVADADPAVVTGVLNILRAQKAP
jgi:hypothetical protein